MKKILVAIAVLLLILVLLGACLLADMARPRHDEFVQRRDTTFAVILEPAQVEAGGFTSQGLQLRADSGLVVNARLLRPAEADGRLPVVVLLGGHRTGRDAVSLVGHPGGAAMIAIDYPYHGRTQIRSSMSFFRGIGEIQQALLDTPPAASLLLDWLATQPWADTSRAELVGVSFGVPFVAVAGALDTRFSRVWMIHGGAGNRGWIRHNLRDRIPSDTLRWLATALVHLLVYGNSFDTGEWAARIAPRPVVIIGARDDERLPEHKVENLYQAAGEPKELIWTDGGHVDPRRPDLVQALLDIVRTRIIADAAEPRAATPDAAETP